MNNIWTHSYIFLTILLSVYSQLVMKWRVSLAGPLPEGLAAKIEFIFQLLVNGWILSGILATFLSGVFWMLAMSKFELIYAYPFIALNFMLVLILSPLLFGEIVSLTKIIGTLFVIAGIIVIARG